MSEVEKSSFFSRVFREKLAAGLTLASLTATGASGYVYTENFGATVDQKRLESDIAILKREIQYQTQRSNQGEIERLNVQLRTAEEELASDTRSPAIERTSEIALIAGTLFTIGSVGIGLGVGNRSTTENEIKAGKTEIEENRQENVISEQ